MGGVLGCVDSRGVHFDIKTHMVLNEFVLSSVRELLALAKGKENLFQEYVQQYGKLVQQETLKAQRREQ